MMIGLQAARPWTFRLPVPPAGWLQLDLDDTTRPISALPAGGMDPAGFAGVIDRCARDAKRRGAIVAFVRWRPGEQTGPDATLNVTAIARQSEGGDEIGVLGSALAAAQEADLSPRVVELVDLPVGRALRVRVYAIGGRTPAGDAVIDAVQYWLPVPNTPQLLVASASTTDVDRGDDVAALLDRMMAGLTVQVPA
jgi:hypothetical protein